MIPPKPAEADSKPRIEDRGVGIQARKRNALGANCPKTSYVVRLSIDIIAQTC